MRAMCHHACFAAKWPHPTAHPSQPTNHQTLASKTPTTGGADEAFGGGSLLDGLGLLTTALFANPRAAPAAGEDWAGEREGEDEGEGRKEDIVLEIEISVMNSECAHLDAVDVDACGVRCSFERLFWTSWASCR